MNKIEELLVKYCPEGVPKCRLGDVCEFQRGTTITSKDAVKGNVPVIAGGQTPSYYHNTSNRSGDTISVAGSGAYAGYVAYWTIPVYLSDAFSVNPRENISARYVYHFLKMNQDKIYRCQKGAGIPHVHGKDLASFIIPIPPLPVQQEIVHILDSFTDLQQNLQQELEARKKQFEVFREKLLSFNETVCGSARLDSICEVINGRAYKQEELLSSGKYRVLRVGNFFSNDSWYYSDLELDDKYYCSKGDLLYAWL